MDLVKKYKIGEHLDSLHSRLGKERFKQDGGYFEDLLGPDDPDVAPIIAFRAECDKHDASVEKYRMNVAEVIAQNKQLLLRQFIQGKTVVYMAKELDIDPGLLYYHIKKDPDLHNVYHTMRYRRGYVAKNNSAKIWEMLDQGYSKTVIAATVGVSPNQVKYQQARRQKMGLA